MAGGETGRGEAGMTGGGGLPGTAAGLIAAYKARSLSPVEVLTSAFARLDQIKGSLNPVSHEDREASFAAARASEARWLKGEPRSGLDGVIASVKSNVMKTGWPMRRGSRLSSDRPMAFDAPCVASLERAGAVILCQTTMPEFGWKGTGDSPLTGVTRNPHDPSRTPGGSSAGAGVLAALGIGQIHIGTDGLGSIRIPASFCGVVGVKPSFGRVPAYPASPFGALAHIGPMARSVADAVAMFQVIAQPDWRDMHAWNQVPPDLSEGLEAGVRGLAFAWSPTLGFVKGLDPEVLAICEKAVAALEAAGAVVERADPALDGDAMRGAADVLWQAGAAALMSDMSDSRQPEQDPRFVAAYMAGRKLSAVDVVKAHQFRAALAETMRQFHERHQILLTPTMPITAIEVGRDTPADGSWGEDWLNWSPYTYPFNLTGQPAASVPVGRTRAGMPVGLQLVASPRSTLLMRCARAIEAAVEYRHL